MSEMNSYRKLFIIIIGLMALFLTIAGTAWVRADNAAEAVSAVRERQGVVDEQISTIKSDLKEIKSDVKQLLQK